MLGVRVKKALLEGNPALSQMAKSHSLGARIEAEDIAHAALYLASDEFRMVPSQVVAVDSGLTIS